MRVVGLKPKYAGFEGRNIKMSKSIKKNYIYNVIYQALLLLAPLITTPYISRVLSANGVGQYSFSSSIVSYFVLAATMGTTIYGQREVSYCQDSREKRSRIFWEIELLNCASVLFSVIVYICFMGILHFPMIYLIQLFSLLSVAADVSWLFSGMEEFGSIVSRNIIFKCISIAFIFVAVRSRNDVLIYVFGLCFLSFLSALSLWPALPHLVNRVKLKDMKPLTHLRNDLSLFVPTIAIQIYTVLDKTMIGIITSSDAENGYYEQAIKMSRMALTIVTALGIVMVPRIGNLYKQQDYDKIRYYMYRAYNFVWLFAIPLCFGLIGISANLVPWFFGDGFSKVVPLLSILSFLILAIGVNNVTGIQYMIPTKRQNLFTLTVCVGAVVDFCLNLCLIPRFLSIGAAIASVVAEATITVLQLFLLRREISGWKVLKLSRNYLISGIIMLVVLYFESKYLASSIINTCIMLVTGVIIYIILLLVFRDRFFMECTQNVSNYFKQKLSQNH